MSDKMVLGNIREKGNKDLQNDNFTLSQSETPIIEESIKPLYENMWGNDNKVLNMLDEKQKADRRLYTRALYMQRIECNFVLDNLESDPTLLSKPLEFMVIDISMGGIGIICEQELEIGTILIFKLRLDNMIYDVKYEVVYCFQNDGKYRAGLKIAYNDKQFIKHLKIVVARLSLQSIYGARLNNATVIS